jgi:hypothetical protein
MSDFSGWSFALGVAAGVGQLMLFDWLERRRWRKHLRRRNDQGRRGMS